MDVENKFVVELSQLIEQSRFKATSFVNHTITILFWQVGNHINKNILQSKRAGYAKEIGSTVSTQLKMQYGRNFELRNLRRMMQFAEQFTDIGTIAP